MKASLIEKGRLVLYGVAILASLALLVNVLFAWFTSISTPGLEFSLAVVSMDDSYNGIMDITYIDDGGGEVTGGTAGLWPGKSNVFKIDITNNGSSQITYRLKFEKITVTQAVFSGKTDSYICDMYSADGTIPYEPDLETINSTQLLKAMSEPVTNAMGYYCAKENAYDHEFKPLDSAQKEQMMTAFDDDSEVAGSEYYKEFKSADDKVIYQEREIDLLYADGDTVGGNIIIEGNQTVTIYLVLCFFDQVGTDGVFDGQTLLMKNSNGFMRQKVTISLGLTTIID